MQIEQVVVVGQKRVELQTGELDAALAPDELLVRTEWTFVSAGTELANYIGREPAVFEKGRWCSYPWKAGYANVGVVEEVGANVTRCKPGDRVFTMAPHASFVKLDARSTLVVPVPAKLDPCEAVATRMAGVGSSAAVMAEPRLHPWVVVYGLGMVGNLAAQSFAILGGRVIGVDPVARRRELAARCGLRWVVGGTAEEALQAVAKITGERMADIAVEATGLTPVLLQALKATAEAGQLLLLGSPRAPLQGDITEAFRDIHFRCITVRGALEWSPPLYPITNPFGGRTLAVPSLYDKQTMIFDWVLQGQMQVAPLVTHRLPPARIRDAYEGLLQDVEQYIGVALDWRAKA